MGQVAVFMKLFLKIFIWFWLAMVLVGAALIISVATTSEEQAGPPWLDFVESALRLQARQAADAFERGGLAALDANLKEVERGASVEAYLFDEQGMEVRGRTPPAGAAAVVRQSAERTTSEFRYRPPYPLAAQRVTGLSGKNYVFVVQMRGNAFGFSGRGLGKLGLRIALVLLTGGVVCYGLARYLVAPIIKLRAATRRLAGGDLSARASPKIGNRRDELAYLGRDFDVMAERIEALVTAERRLLGDISHELRSPLARLGVALDLARRHAAPENGKALDQAHQRIGYEAEQLNQLIEQLLALTRLESSVNSSESDGAQPVDLAALVREVADDADFEARSRNRQVHIVASCQCRVLGNQELLRSAVENVVRNGVHYTAEGTAVEITLDCLPDQDRASARIRVRDYGEGVREEELEQLFLPFYRTADARDRQTGGTGLGLAITSRAVRLYNGSVTARNAAGGGLVVDILLPAMQDD
jgi:signal transduction histidine kinase